MRGAVRWVLGHVANDIQVMRDNQDAQAQFLLKI